MPTARYAILHHRTTNGEHWDFMLDTGTTLATWQLDAEPINRTSLPISARRIADHRQAYLDYEGPVSDGRGEVTRIDAGGWTAIRADENRWEFRLESERLRGSLVL